MKTFRRNRCIYRRETKLERHKKFDLSGFYTYRIDRTHKPGGGIIFLVRKGLKFIPIPDLCGTTDDLKTGVIKLQNLNSLNLAVCYRFPERPVSQIECNQFFPLSVSMTSSHLRRFQFQSYIMELLQYKF